MAAPPQKISYLKAKENLTGIVLSPELNEHELIELLKRGDEPAFKTVVNTYKNMVYNTVLGFVQHPDDADDITQEVFIKVYQHIGKFNGQARLSTWIYRISITQSLDFIRYRDRKKRFGIITSLFRGDKELPEPVDFVHPGILAENKERSAILFGAINKLPEKQQTAFLLQKVQDCSQQRIAEIMQLSEGAVESLLSRARANLKKMLTNYYTQL